MAQIKKTILIITATEDGLEATQSYLAHRGWSIRVTNDLREAVNQMVADPAEVVLICMDHPNKKVQELPTIIRERVRCCVIATAQKSTLENYHLLHRINCDYKSFPPISGPAVERVVHKFIKRTEALFGEVRPFELKRSGISPKSFRVNNAAERPGVVLDYGNLDPKLRFDINGKSPLEGKFSIITPVNAIGERIPAVELLTKGTDRIISEILEPANPNSSEPPIELKTTTHITCMLIESKSFQGYMVAALGRDCHIDAGFTGLVQRNLIKFLQDQGEVITSSEVFQMNIKPVAFLDWAEEYADFLRKSVHKDNEIAFAFFPIESLKSPPTAAASDDMLSVPIHELHGESHLNFNLYIFFPTNRKYVLYTPMGSVFYTHQQERLIRRGVEHVHIKREDLKELNRYRAQKYFNTIVDEYGRADSMSA